MKIVEIACTGYPVTDMKRARAFYEGVLGLKASSVFEHEGGAWVEYDIGPATLAVTNMAPDWKPSSDGGTATLEVEDFDAAVEHLRGKGVTICGDTIETPVCRMLIIADPDGNTITIHKRKM